MRRDDLLRDLAALPYAGRMRRMVELGQRAAAGPNTDAAIASVLAELRTGNGYERRLALQAAWGSRDPAVAADGAADPSRLARRMARNLLAVLGDDAQLLSALDGAPSAARRALLAGMWGQGRHDAIDVVLQSLADQRDPDFGPLLGYGSKRFVAFHLPKAAATAAGLNWRALARHHARAVATFLTEAVRSTAELDSRLAAYARTALPALAEPLPDGAMALAAVLARHVPLASLSLGTLVGRRPAAVADLCLQAPAPCPVSFAGVARQLDRDRLLALLARFGTLGGTPTCWLRRLAPELRQAAYEVANRGWRDADGAITLAILTLMPCAVRQAEAQRHLALPALATRPATRLPYAGLLPWQEACTHLDPVLGDPDPELRAVALATLAASVRFERGRAGDLLRLALARRHEQDPVRRRLLGAVADLPPVIWTAEHLEDLGTAIRHALDAADLSPQTAAEAGRIVVGQLPHHPDWAAGWLATLAREYGAVPATDLAQQLRRDDVSRLAPVLTPVLEEWVQRERDRPVSALATSLGRRQASTWDSLADALQRIVLRGTASSAADALQVLARNRPDRLRALVPDLLREDQSWVTQPPVFTHLHRHRQDLLTPFLGRTAYKGRFATGDVAIVLPFRDGFARWTPAQQMLFAASLGGIIADEQRDSPALSTAVAQLAALPDTGPEALERLAALDEPRPVAREAALRGLGRRDADDGLPILLAALDDARARIAAYALRRSLVEMPVPRALDILREVPGRKVTVAKEVVRLVGELPGEDAYAWLLDLVAPGREVLHRDVFVALLRALWSRLERDETWAILDGAATSPDPAIAAAAARVPGTALSSGTADRLSRLLVALLAHPDPHVRVAALGRCATEPLTDRDEVLLDPLLKALASPLPDECRAAAGAVFATYAGRRAFRVGEVAAVLRVNRFAVSVLVAQVQGRAFWQRDQYAATVEAVLDALSPDPALAGLYAELAVSALPAAALPAWLGRAVETLHGGALPRAVAALEAPQGLRPGELEAIEAALAPAGDERLRRLALPALRGQRWLGWTAARLARLEAFRADPSPMVAEAAQFTFPPGETGRRRAA